MNRIIGLLEVNPWADDTTKFTVIIGGVGMGLYDDGRWEVVNRVVDERFVEVLGISRVDG